MVYRMLFEVDGGCRYQGQPYAIGAAAALRVWRSGRYDTWTKELSHRPPPTSQRAEILAMILALELALEEYKSLDNQPDLDVTIRSDSRYAVGCMSTWVYTWASNGWLNARGQPVANRDLIQKASDLDDDLRELGVVTYTWVPRSENQEADEACNQKLAEMEDD